jgi:hypothetical protein
MTVGRAIAQVVSRWLPTAAVRGSKPDLGTWDLWWDKVALGRFSPSTSVSPAIIVRSTNYSTITLIYHPGKMYNRPMCGRSTGTYTNLGDLQKDLRGLSPTPPNKKNMTVSFIRSHLRKTVRSEDNYGRRTSLFIDSLKLCTVFSLAGSDRNICRLHTG